MGRLTTKISELYNPKDLFDSQRPIFIICFLSGIVPFKVFGESRNRRLQTTASGLMISVSYAVVFSICFILRIRDNESLIRYLFKSEIVMIGDLIQLSTSIVGIFSTLIFCYLKRNKLKSVVYLLIKIDESLERLGARVNYRVMFLISVAVITCKMILFAIFLIGSFYLLHSLPHAPSTSVWILFFLPYLITSMLKVQFICYITQVLNRFRCVNQVLTDIRTEIIKSKITPIRNRINFIKPNKLTICDSINLTPEKKMDTTDMITELCRTHEELCDVCYLIEEYFSHQMLILVAIQFISLVFNVYHISQMVLNSGDYNNEELDRAGFIAFFLYYTIISNATLVYAVFISSSAIAENEKCSIYVHKLLNILNNDNKEMQDGLFQFSMQLLHRKIRFTACGFFPLDNTLTFKMIGAATTYLIILFQMSPHQPTVSNNA